MSILFAGLGASIGALIRFWVTQLGNKLFKTEFPVATFFINITGAFLLGLLFSLAPTKGVYTILGTGILGGYTTFSTFMNEAVQLGEKRRLRELIYVGLSIIIGLLASALGIWLGNQV
ncbi:CrcB family protein [Periweissella cryptocerci]|uniref:Fluoride-specific ion channel FluC n=1 Tax=Periweissella cryptocerci TaxID=2506420 RepID=A0A4P6YTJ5_9LACO|nr:CrcB family protein [Periweissella cryptocerci]QBO36074.1 CrcB family protein [Periweissella cryptocerci]